MKIIIFDFFVLIKYYFYLLFPYQGYLTWHIEKIWYRLLYKVQTYMCFLSAFASAGVYKPWLGYRADKNKKRGAVGLL